MTGAPRGDQAARGPLQARSVSDRQRNGRRLYAVNMRDRVVPLSEMVSEPVLRYYRAWP
jgi:hypothetical protein